MAKSTTYIKAPQSEVLKSLSSSLQEGFDAWFEGRAAKRRKKKTADSTPTRIIDANMARRMNK